MNLILKGAGNEMSLMYHRGRVRRNRCMSWRRGGGGGAGCKVSRVGLIERKRYNISEKVFGGVGGDGGQTPYFNLNHILL